MKMGTKTDARSQRNELDRGDRMRPYKDPMHPISCLATAGVSSCDRTLSEAVTGRTGDTVHRHGSIFSVTGHSRLDDRTHEVQRPIESREVPEQRQRDRMRPVDDDQTLSQVRSTRALQRSGRPDTSGQDVISVRLVAEKWVSSPTATFSVGLINRPLNWPFEFMRAEEIYQGC